MLRTLLTGLVLTLPVDALAQTDAPAQPSAIAPAAQPAAPDAAGTALPPKDPAAAPDAKAQAQPAADGAQKAPQQPADATAQEPPAPQQPSASEPVQPAPAPAQPAAPAQAQAQPEKPVPFLPNLFDVTVLDTWDTLNVRAAPDGQAEVIATLPATAKNVELLGRDVSGKWGKVNAGERTGWVALRFLQLQPGVWQSASLPQSLHCSGTEPFWSLKATKSGMLLSEPDTPDRPLTLRKVMDRGIEGEPTRGLIAGDDKGRLTAFVRPEQCSDGMSDRGYALAVAVILDGQDMPSRMLTGCCSIAR